MSSQDTVRPNGRPWIEGHEDFELIGRGGSAEVYCAREAAFDRLVAVKVFGARLNGEDAAREFRRECLALGQVSGHPAIIRVHTAGTTSDGRPYLTMELMDGSLADKASGGRLPAREVVDIGVTLADAVATAHQAGVLHRDIKPANVLVSRFGAPVLADFGVSLVASSTTTESQLGLTLEHASPEVLRGLPSTERSDVYSLASCLFQLLVGEAPFHQLSREPGAVLVKLAHDRPPAPEVDGLPADLIAVLMGALERDPELRPATAAAFRDELTSVRMRLGNDVDPAMPAAPAAESDPTAASRESTSRPRRGARVAIGVAGAAALAIATVGALLWSGAIGRGANAAPTETAAEPADTETTTLIQELSVMVSDGAPDALGADRQCVTAQFARARPEVLAAMVTGGAGSAANLAAMKAAWKDCGFGATELAPLVVAGQYSSERPELATDDLGCVQQQLALGPAADIAAVQSLTTTSQTAVLDRYVDDQLAAATAPCVDPARLISAFVGRLRSDGVEEGVVAAVEACMPTTIAQLTPDALRPFGLAFVADGDGPLGESYAKARADLATNVVAFAGSDVASGLAPVQLGSGQSVSIDGGASSPDVASVGETPVTC